MFNWKIFLETLFTATFWNVLASLVNNNNSVNHKGKNFVIWKLIEMFRR